MTRKGSGRTKGAGSFVAVNWGDLEKVLKPDATVIVSRRYAEQLQLNCKAFKATTENISSVAQQIQFTETEIASKPLTGPNPEGRSLNDVISSVAEELEDDNQIQINELNW